MGTIYQGSFLSRISDEWTVLINKDGVSDSIAGELTFDGDDSVSIEWSEIGKMDVLQGSSCTIRIISPGDRTYIDLYTVKAGDVWMQLFRNGSLYWQGALDPEFYEEPYECLNNYTVSLTFSDFGLWRRLKFSGSGMISIYNLLADAAERAHLPSVAAAYISLGKTSASDIWAPYNDLVLSADNFIDEEGEAMTLSDVIEGALKPLGFRLIQQLGRLRLYDLNGLATLAPTEEITWSASSQTLSVDSVYNNAIITWSTYALTDDLLNTTVWPEDITIDERDSALNLLDGATSNDDRYWSWHSSNEKDDWADYTDIGFTMHTSVRGENIESIDSNARFFKTVPYHNGSDDEGVMLIWRGVKYLTDTNKVTYTYRSFGMNPDDLSQWNVAGTEVMPRSILLKTPAVHVPPSRGAQMKVTLPLLMSWRVNYNSQTSDDINQETNDNRLTSHANFVYLPVIIIFTPDNGGTQKVWTNREYIYRNLNNVQRPTLNSGLAFGKWVDYVPTQSGVPNEWGYLAYYNQTDLTNNSAVGNGWADNSQAIYPWHNELYADFAKAEKGQIIGNPSFDCGGTITIEVRDGGWLLGKAQKETSDKTILDYALENKAQLLLDNLMWLGIQAPRLSFVQLRRFKEYALPADDIEYSAQINNDAQEDIKIDTICGTWRDDVPTARGAYLDASTGTPITTFYRGGRTDCIEELLLGTIYSQYAERHTVLSGEADARHGGLRAYTEPNQGTRKFIAASCVHSVIANTWEVKLIELSKDEYNRSNG